MADFEKIFASNSPLAPYEWQDGDYLRGWDTVGSAPPTRGQFDALQRRNDEKLLELKNAVDGTGGNISAAIAEHNTATDAHENRFSQYLPLSGGALSGERITKDSNDSKLEIIGGTNFYGGSYLQLYGSNHAGAGKFGIGCANTANKFIELVGKPDGSLTWAGKEIKSMAFPSSTVVNITSALGTRYTTYTAPANGFITIMCENMTIVGAVWVQTMDKYISNCDHAQDVTNSAGVTIPVKKGDVVVNKSTAQGTFECYFIYAEGEV